MNLRKISNEIRKVTATKSLKFINTHEMKQSFKKIQKELKDAVSTKPGKNEIFFINDASRRKAFDILGKDYVKKMTSWKGPSIFASKIAQLKLDSKLNQLGIPMMLVNKLRNFGIDRNAFAYKDPMSGGSVINPAYVLRKINQSSIKMPMVGAIYGNSGTSWFLAVNKGGVWDFYDEGRISTPRYKNVTIQQGVRRLESEPYELWFIGKEAPATDSEELTNVEKQKFEKFMQDELKQEYAPVLYDAMSGYYDAKIVDVDEDTVSIDVEYGDDARGIHKEDEILVDRSTMKIIG